MRILLSLAFLIGCSRAPGTRVPKATPERTLWAACWNAKGGLDLPSDDPPHKPECRRPAPIKWPGLPQKPLIVVMATEIPIGNSALYDVKAAIVIWNNVLGFTAFEFDSDPVVPDVLVHVTAERICRGFGCILGIALHGRDIVTKRIQVNVGLFGNPGLETTVHEFGHVLGLSHDNESPYVMRRWHRDSKHILVSPADVAAIHKLYKVKVK